MWRGQTSQTSGRCFSHFCDRTRMKISAVPSMQRDMHSHKGTFGTSICTMFCSHAAEQPETSTLSCCEFLRIHFSRQQVWSKVVLDVPSGQWHCGRQVGALCKRCPEAIHAGLDCARIVRPWIPCSYPPHRSCRCSTAVSAMLTYLLAVHTAFHVNPRSPALRLCLRAFYLLIIRESALCIRPYDGCRQSPLVIQWTALSPRCTHKTLSD